MHSEMIQTPFPWSLKKIRSITQLNHGSGGAEGGNTTYESYFHTFFKELCSKNKSLLLSFQV